MMDLSKKDISFIQPSRNNLKYLKWSYDSIRKNAGDEPTICVADDFSNDGTWEWCEKMMSIDPNFKAIRNEGPTRLGHTILYDRLINEVATTKVVGIYHADMWLCPGALESVLKYIKPMTVVSLTRIEPDLHPPGPEKVLIKNAPTEPEDFDESWFMEFFNNYIGEVKGKTTEGIFAPWFIYKEDFTSIGGHDPLYAPQSKEDSDIFNRFMLNGYNFVQTWEGCVFHLTCRGSRFNPTITNVGQNSNEWQNQNIRSTRNFIRKWGHFVKHDKYMKPIIPHKYNIGFVVKNCTIDRLRFLEVFCDNIYTDTSWEDVTMYVKEEKSNTPYDLSDRIRSIEEAPKNDVIVYIDGNLITNGSQETGMIQMIPEILDANNLEVGEYELGNIRVKVNTIKTYDSDLIVLEK